MHFRQAENRDLEEICALVECAVNGMEEKNIFQWDSLYPTRQDFEQDIGNKELYVGTIDGNITVIYTLNKKSDDEYKAGKWRYTGESYKIIHRLCVHPKFQNKKIAQKTLLHIEDYLKGSGISSIRLDVFSNNPFALKLYLNNGYEKVGTANWRKGCFYLMEKNL